MEEIAEEFKKELQELLDRYKDRLTNPQIMRIAQPIFTKTIGFRDNPDRFKKVPLSSEEEQMLEAGGMQSTGTYNQYGQPLIKNTVTGNVLPLCRVISTPIVVNNPCGPLTDMIAERFLKENLNAQINSNGR